MITIRDIKSPFHLYDFFGYLLPGFLFYLLLFFELKYASLEKYCRDWHCGLPEGFSIFLINDPSILPRTRIDKIFFSGYQQISFLSYVSFLIICYLTGHIIGSISSVVLEKIILK